MLMARHVRAKWTKALTTKIVAPAWVESSILDRTAASTAVSPTMANRGLSASREARRRGRMPS